MTTISLQARKANDDEWSTRNAFVMENALLRIGRFDRQELLDRAYLVMQAWSAYRDDVMLRVHEEVWRG